MPIRSIKLAHVNAARAAGVADGLGGEQRLLQRSRGADVRPRRARAHRDADAGLGEIDPAAGNDLALPDQFFQFGRWRSSTRSYCSPAAMRFMIAVVPDQVVETVWPDAFSNCGTSSR